MAFFSHLEADNASVTNHSKQLFGSGYGINADALFSVNDDRFAVAAAAGGRTSSTISEVTTASLHNSLVVSFIFITYQLVVGREYSKLCRRTGPNPTMMIVIIFPIVHYFHFSSSITKSRSKCKTVGRPTRRRRTFSPAAAGRQQQQQQSTQTDRAAAAAQQTRAVSVLPAVLYACFANDRSIRRRMYRPLSDVCGVVKDSRTACFMEGHKV